MRVEAENKKIDLQFSAPSKISLIHADRNSMEGIFTNLISNAIKYTPEGGKVWVTLGEEGGFVKATVSDTGIGIKREDLSRIFDKFYRVKSQRPVRSLGQGSDFLLSKVLWMPTWVRSPSKARRVEERLLPSYSQKNPSRRPNGGIRLCPVLT